MKFILIVLAFFISNQSFSQEQFPLLSGESLLGEMLEIPQGVMGKKTILGLAYSKKADEDLRTWFEPAYHKFISPPKVSFMPEDPFDGNIFFIPMLQGLAKTVSGKIEKELKEGIDPKLHKYVIVYKGSINEYKDALEMSSASSPYFFVLDEGGNILFKTEGAYSEEKMEEIEAFFE